MEIAEAEEDEDGNKRYEFPHFLIRTIFLLTIYFPKLADVPMKKNEF